MPWSHEFFDPINPIALCTIAVNFIFIEFICQTTLVAQTQTRIRSLYLSKKSWGPFIYYVSTFVDFLEPSSSYISTFYVLKISKNCHFLTPLPPTSAYVIYEWSIPCCNKSLQGHNVSWCFFQNVDLNFTSS